MAFNINDTHTLLASVKLLPPLHTFLRDRYFPTNEARDIFATTDVLVEYKNGTKKAAPFVAPRKGGIAVLREGHTMKRFTPAFIAPKRTLTSDDLQKRGFGEALYTNMSPDQREGVLIMGDLDELRTMNERRIEVMAASAIFNNAVVMHEYTDDLGEKYEEREVRYYDEAQNPAVYYPAERWDTSEESGKQMIADLAAMISMLTSRGLPATDVIMAPDVADVFLANEWILKLLDIRNLHIGGVDPETLPAGASKIARINVKGRMVDILVYEDTYEDIDGAVKPFVPEGMIAVGAPNAGRTLYGAITQMEESDHKFHTHAAANVPKYIGDVAHDVREVRLASAPLPIPNNQNPFICAKVLNFTE